MIERKREMHVRVGRGAYIYVCVLLYIGIYMCVRIHPPE